MRKLFIAGLLLLLLGAVSIVSAKTIALENEQRGAIYQEEIALEEFAFIDDYPIPEDSDVLYPDRRYYTPYPRPDFLKEYIRLVVREELRKQGFCGVN